MTTVKERPILFSAPMVRAILAGSKTQTRRVVKHPALSGERGWWPTIEGWIYQLGGSARPKCPYGRPGDRLWVRETFCVTESAPFDDGKTSRKVIYRADLKDGDDQPHRWIPSIHLFRCDSRITLEITGVRVERLNDISVEDCRAEGIEFRVEVPTKQQFQRLWESINGAGSWALNPWVWAITFKVLK